MVSPARIPVVTALLLSVLLGLNPIGQYGYAQIAHGQWKGWYEFTDTYYPIFYSLRGSISRERFTSWNGESHTAYILNLDAPIKIKSDYKARVDVTRLQILFLNVRKFLPIARSLIGKHVVIMGQLWLKVDRPYATEVTIETGDDGACSIVESGPAANLCTQRIGWYEYDTATPYKFSGRIGVMKFYNASAELEYPYILTLDTPINVKEEWDHGDQRKHVKNMQVIFVGEKMWKKGEQGYENNTELWSFIDSTLHKHVEVLGSLMNAQTAHHHTPVMIRIDVDNPQSIKVLSK